MEMVDEGVDLDKGNLGKFTNDPLGIHLTLGLKIYEEGFIL